MKSCRRDYLINVDQEAVDKYMCSICYDIVLEPVKCAGSCASLYCRKCASQWKAIKGGCPKKCSKPWVFKKLMEPSDLQFSCSYGCIVTGAEKFTNHFKQCTKLPPDQLQIQSRYLNYQCSNGHDLQFYTASYTEMIGSNCSECHQKQVTRSRCSKCDLIYCVKCRVPSCSQEGCPLGHKFEYQYPSSANYICDLCGIAGAFTDFGVYDDSACNFGVCSQCYSNLPKHNDKKQFTQRLRFKQDKMLCLEGHFLSKKLSSDYQPGKQCHLCSRNTTCIKVCEQCKTWYCGKCKPPTFTLSGHCQLKHKYAYSQQPRQCSICTTNLVQNYAYDQLCDTAICWACASKLSSVESSKERLRNQLCCEVGHPLKWTQAPGTYCHLCQCMPVYAQLICNQCEIQKFYCLKCRKVDFKEGCYYGHPMKSLQNCACLMCKKTENILGCPICGLFLCMECIDSMK